MDSDQVTMSQGFSSSYYGSVVTSDDIMMTTAVPPDAHPDSMTTELALDWTTPESILHSMNSHGDKETVQDIFGPLMFTVVIIGVLGNITSFVVMSTRSFRQLAISRAIRSLAVSDCLYLISIINNQPWYRQLLGIDIRGVNDAMCKLVNWTTRSTAIFSAWMVILLAVERFFAIWFFEITGKVFSVRKMTISIIIIVALTATFNAVWTNHSDAIVGGVCIANARNDLITKNFLLACVILYVGIPAPILFILNILIIFKLWRHSQRSKASGSVKIPQQRVTAMLLGVTFVFVLLVPPIALCHMTAQILGENLFATNYLPLFIVGQTAQLMFVLNCAINFFLYVVMGSTFRNKLVAMLCGPCRHAKANSSSKRGTISSMKNTKLQKKKVSKTASQEDKIMSTVESKEDGIKVQEQGNLNETFVNDNTSNHM